ncbi:chemotaxis response regulator protein-glutamate methylesterase CheB [Bacillus sp. JCM 19047]|nr:chemotaxis response regulator protein-glutamate methylesterase CheB [Bacillus sp. JCM 19047]
MQKLFEQLPNQLPYPIVIAQHMPGHFTALLAKRLNEQFSFQIKEAQHDEPVQTGVVYIAPGGWQTTLIQRGNRAFFQITEPNQNDLYHPSINTLFASTTFFNKKILIILTGMGRDGSASLQPVKQSGGCTILAEAEESAIISGMPHAAVKTGQVDWELTHIDIGKWLHERGASL